MDYTSSVRWLSELGLDDPDFIHHYEMSSLEQATTPDIAQVLAGSKAENHNHQQQTHQQHANNNNNSNQHSVSGESYSNSPYTSSPVSALPPPKAVQQLEPPASRPAKVLKTSGSWKSSPAYSSYSYSPEAQVPAVVPEASSPTPRILSFGGSCNDYPAAPVVTAATAGGRQQQAPAFGPFGRALVKPKEDFSGFSISHGSTVTAAGFGAGGNNSNKRGATAMTNAGSGGSKPPSTSQDHIIAERKRREKLSQRFIALSAIVPGLKKMDKATVLADAIKYVKQLQERVKGLEDLTAKRTVESVVLVKKSQLVPSDDDTSSSDENFDGASAAKSDGTGEPSSLPEIEAKVTDKTVLLRVHCHKRKGVLVKLLAEIERLHLSVVNTSVMPFAGSVLDITIIAQMDEEFSMSVKDLVRALNAAITSM